MAQTRISRRPAPTARWSLTLFDEWRLRRGRTCVPLHLREQRLVSLLALQGSRPRGYVAGVLWPDSSERHATGNLRSAVWCTEQEAPGLLEHDRSSLRLTAPLQVDVHTFTRTAFRVLTWLRHGQRVEAVACLRVLPVLLHGGLLPGWYDDWVLYEQARLAQLRLRALQVVADLLVDLGEPAEARMAATAAAAIEPLHEPTIRSLIRADIEEGDVSAALRDYDAYRTRVLTDLGVAPTAQLDALVQPLLEARRDGPNYSVA